MTLHLQEFSAVNVKRGNPKWLSIREVQGCPLVNGIISDGKTMSKEDAVPDARERKHKKWP